jgi:tripartite-type tricarboxylate transporter receptor subunit TctC
MMRTFVRLMSAAALVAPLVCAAQDFPAKGKVITQIVPFGAGGGADITARAVQPWLEKELGVSMPIINKPGGGGQVGFTEFLKTAKPDGYTIVWALLPGTPASYLDPKRQAKFTRKDFKLVANVALDPVSIVVKPDSKFKNLRTSWRRQKRTLARSRLPPGDGHLARRRGQIGSPPAQVRAPLLRAAGQAARRALSAATPTSGFNPVSETAAEITSGQLRALALCDGQPSRYVPQVPTAISQGVKCSVASVRGIAVPAGTPDNVVSALANAVRKVLADPENQKQLDKIKLATRFMTGKEYEEYWAETEKTVAAGLKAMPQK